MFKNLSAMLKRKESSVRSVESIIEALNELPDYSTLSLEILEFKRIVARYQETKDTGLGREIHARALNIHNRIEKADALFAMIAANQIGEESNAVHLGMLALEIFVSPTQRFSFTFDASRSFDIGAENIAPLKGIGNKVFTIRAERTGYLLMLARPDEVRLEPEGSQTIVLEKQGMSARLRYGIPVHIFVGNRSFTLLVKRTH